jgi:arylsulfatase A-like enzyme
MSKSLTNVKNHIISGFVFTIISIIYLNLVTVAKFYLAGGDFLRIPATDKTYVILQIVKGNSWPFALVGAVITLFLLLVVRRFDSLRSGVTYLYLALFVIFGIVIQTHQLTKAGVFTNPRSLGFMVSWLVLAVVAFALYYLLSKALFLVLERSRSSPKLLSLGLAALAVTLLVSLLLPQFGRATSASTEGYNVLLLTVDTLRKDHLSYDGYYRPTSPHLDEFAKEAVVFKNAYSATSHTLPSLASVITGKYPMHHGVRNNASYALADTNLTLAEVFRKRGFVTGAIVENGALRPTRNYHQGFDYYGEAYYVGSIKYEIPGLIMLNKISKIFGEKMFIYPGGEAEHVTNMAMRFLKKNRDKSFFCWVHYIDPHLPYSPPPGYDNKFCKREDHTFAPDIFTISRHLRKYELTLPPSAAVVEKVRALYDGEIAYCDLHIGRLLKALEEMNLTSKTLIIFSADHGESLADHYYYLGHGRLVYNANIAVPLMIRFPDLRHKGVVKDRVSNVNILPTILDFMGFEETFPGGIDGVSLMPLIAGGRRDYLPSVHSQSGVPWSFDPRLFDEIERGGVNPLKTVAAKLAVDTRFGMEATLQEQIELKLRAVIKDNWKLIYVPVMDSSLPSGRRCYYELYDVESDWDERYNLLDSHPEIFQALKAEVDSWLAADTGTVFADVIEMEPEDIEALRALGYIQ